MSTARSDMISNENFLHSESQKGPTDVDWDPSVTAASFLLLTSVKILAWQSVDT